LYLNKKKVNWENLVAASSGSPSLSKVQSLIQSTSSEIEAFNENLDNKSQNLPDDRLSHLVESLESTTEAIQDYGKIKGQSQLTLDPSLAKRLLTCIGHIVTKSRQEKGSSLIAALNALEEFKSAIQSLNQKEDKSLKRGRKVEKADLDKLD
jgi:hypothetical protein